MRGGFGAAIAKFLWPLVVLLSHSLVVVRLLVHVQMIAWKSLVSEMIACELSGM